MLPNDREESLREREDAMDAIIHEIVNHHDGGEDYLEVLRHVISQLGDGYATFTGGMSRARRRELIRQVFACHREHRARRQRGRGSRSAPPSSVGLPRDGLTVSMV